MLLRLLAASVVLIGCGKLGFDPAEVRNIRVLALRTTGLASFDFTASVAFASSMMSRPAAISTLIPATATAQLPSYVSVGSMRLEADCANTAPADRGSHFDYEIAGGGTLAEVASHVTENCAYETTYGSVRWFAGRPTSISAGISSGNGQLVHHKESSLVLLGLE